MDRVAIDYRGGESYLNLVARAFPTLSKREIRRLFESGAMESLTPVAATLAGTRFPTTLTDPNEIARGNLEIVRVGKRRAILVR